LSCQSDDVPQYTGSYQGSSSADLGDDDPTVSVGYRWEDLLPDEIPVLSITTEGEVEVVSREEYTKASADLSAFSEELSFENRSVSLRCRGNFSYYGKGVQKKSYRLKFDEKVNLLGIGQGASRNWVLLANWSDRSLLRNTAAFAMASCLRFSFTSSTTFVHLFVNGEDLGIYQLCEHPTLNKSRISLSQDSLQVDSDYLLELDNRAYKTGQEGIDYFTAAGNEFVVKNKEIAEDTFSFLQEWIEELYRVLQEGSQEEIEELIDTDSFVDMYLLQEMVCNYDVGWASFYLIKKAGGKLYCTFPWDFDLAFGNDTELNGGSYEGLYVGNPAYLGTKNCNEMLVYLMEKTWFVDLVAARWEEIGSTLRDRALYEISRYYTSWGDQLASNFSVWNILGTYFFPLPAEIYQLTSYSQLYTQLYRWIENRYEWLTDYFQSEESRYLTCIEEN
jgi:hypothetical protein